MSEEVCTIPIGPHVPPEERVRRLNELALEGAEDAEVKRVTEQAVGGLTNDREIATALLERVHQVPFWAYPIDARMRDCFAPAAQALKIGGDCFPLSQKIIVRSRSTGMYELLAIGDLRHVYSSYEALSYNFSSCKYEFKTIVGFVDKGVKPVSKARLSNGTDLVATNDHEFWSGKRSSEAVRRTMGEYVEMCADCKMGRLSTSAQNDGSLILQASQLPDALDTECDLSDLLYGGNVLDALPFGEAHVGCIEVEDNHNFFLADGTLVSNCDNLSVLYGSMATHAGIPVQIVWINQPTSQLNHVTTMVYVDGRWRWADPSIKGAHIGEDPYTAARRTGNGAPLGIAPAGVVEPGIQWTTPRVVGVGVVALLAGIVIGRATS